MPLNGAAHRRGTNYHAGDRRPLLTEILKGGIRLNLQEVVELRSEGASFDGRTTRTGFGRQLAGLTSLFEVPFKGRERNLEGAYHVRPRHATIDCFHDSLT